MRALNHIAACAHAAAVLQPHQCWEVFVLWCYGRQQEKQGGDCENPTCLENFKAFVLSIEKVRKMSYMWASSSLVVHAS